MVMMESLLRAKLLFFTRFKFDSMFEKEILKETPSIIKIDVDGIEHLILQGAKIISLKV